MSRTEVAALRRLFRRDRGACLEFRPALLALFERDPAGGPGEAALDHLERCSRCRAEVAEARLAGYAVERAWRDARTATPAAEGWSRLKARVERRPVRGGPSASPILALALGMGITVALMLPVTSPRWSAATIEEAVPGFVVAPDGSRPGFGVVDGSALQALAPAVYLTVEPVNADPVSAPRRPLATIAAAQVAVISQNEAPRRTPFADQDPRRVGQPPSWIAPDPVSAPKRFNTV